MPGHADLPKRVQPVVLHKRAILDRLKELDSDANFRQRVLQMESQFRDRGKTLLEGLPVADSTFAKFRTNPFVLMLYSKQKRYSRVREIERDLVSTKVFSSMETSAGRMIEQIVLPVYGWQTVESGMHSFESLLDGKCLSPPPQTFVGATLKSGPRTLNDGMVRNIAEEVVTRAANWAVQYQVRKVDFTYGVLYGTKRQSNKKDWHILRSIDEVRPATATVTQSHKGNWSISYRNGALTVSATVRVGLDWWTYLGGKDAWLELCCSLIRSCITPVIRASVPTMSKIPDMKAILDMSFLEDSYNVSILQRYQLEWLLFLARHFCDSLEE